MTTVGTTPTLEPAISRGTFAPPVRTPIPELVEALKRLTTLQGLEDSEYTWLAEHGEELLIPAGATLFHEGDTADTMSILLRGEIHVRRERVGPSALFIGRAGQITGLLP